MHLTDVKRTYPNIISGIDFLFVCIGGFTIHIRPDSEALVIPRRLTATLCVGIPLHY